ncbi:hypothetical protein ABBQ32_009329 [Trebouxia sp. C0010 RCD-2024]
MLQSLHVMPRTASQQLFFLRKVLDCAPNAGLRDSQVFSLSRRHYQTGLQEVEPWPHAKSAIEEAETPPSSWYTSPAVLQAELATVFQKSWLWMGEASKLQQPGDFITSLVTDRPFVACIDQQGQLKAYHNVCRHHAAAVCDDAQGNTQQFACPYHGWVYGLDGRLQKASKLKGIKNFKASDMGLLPVSVDTWGGFALIQTGKDRAISLRDWLGSGGDAMQRAGISLAGMRHVHSRTYHLHCNWKVFCDNYLDGGYHVPFAHKELASGLQMDSYTSSLYERLSVQSCGPQRASVQTPDQRLGGQSAAYAFVYPNLMLNRYGPWLDLNVVEPTGPQTCTVRFEYFLQEGFSPDKGYLQESLEASETVQQEDVKLCEAVQRGLKSPAYDTGRYAPSVEGPMLHFHQLLHQDLLQ